MSTNANAWYGRAERAAGKASHYEEMAERAGSTGTGDVYRDMARAARCLSARYRAEADRETFGV